ncbi:TetR/AcrR family transcriptional regulator [Lapidilactobacillus gannanensis]|uniref:TetR/AcrR family transcriptional regulator n=1 Tax=Lapidilactobacillus gannanensis TaxID=2486002 RepID=A0ABW4BL47_9LACO|nr:TetR/AcrR family transcriptional regulator [Lapidilactobacillus gannanensis]
MSTTEITKRAFVQALLELTEKHDFSQITVSMLTRQVGMHRQSFYYHFHDKYELLAYIYQTISFHYLDSGKVTFTNWQTQVEKMLTSIADHQSFYLNTTASDQNTLLLTFSRVVQGRLQDMLTELDPEHRLSDYDRQFYTEFFGYGCGGVLVDWISNNFTSSPQEIAQKLSKLVADLKQYSPSL